MKTMNESEVRLYQRKVVPRKMKNTSLVVLLAGLLALTTGLFAETMIPAGTILPLQLNTSLNSKKSRPGQIVTARLMQDVPLPSGAKIRVGARVVGHIIDVNNARAGSGAKLSLRFDTLEVSKRRIPVTTNLRALASMMEVEDAQIPKVGPDHGTPENWWTTVQVGGDAVYHGDAVTNGLRIVGKPTGSGVLVQVASKPGFSCRGTFGVHYPQALWVFSADACGTYGFADLTIAHAGRSNPIGTITIASEKNNFDVRSGSGILLRVN